ncbi:TPA: hypothetical protein N0F65_006027 [Lagenidium giganteum]|uniref:Uncharacterized protein n=1 Tax=Lagenidium giganteum TaxID=4803 RepID=A0AAV2Z8N0_9STRA|nr:TPA: hypothetical protein N0F65_006027 [Lagenidium giganteum]
METKSLSATKQTYVNALVGHVIPAVEAKWPQSCRHQSIVMQNDNTPPHKVEANTNTVDAFNELSREALYNTLVTLQTVMHECLLASGGNQYKIPHLNKKKLQREGDGLVNVECSQRAYNAAPVMEVTILEHYFV